MISTTIVFQMMLMMTQAHQLTKAAALKILTMLEAGHDDRGLSLEITLSLTLQANSLMVIILPS